ncbi:E3 ubiquitin-protein ligase RNF149 isoform X2 [Paroedura picta]|uniref:E3 ubiquitin-protein ligase RNF149 isoform X2 n=1 Tax=Paroedura picta TaxID=143630 RepID=UPI004055F237
MLGAPRVALPLLLAASGGPRVAWGLVWYSAWVSTVYTEPGANRTVRASAESGRYGDASPKESAQGLVGIPRGLGARRMEGCGPDVEYEVPGAPRGPPHAWIVLLAHGGCRLKEKIAHAARKGPAAVVVYNEPQFGNSTLTMPHFGTGNTVVIMVGYPKGMEILEPVRRGIPVKMTIDVGTRHIQEYRFLYTGTQFGNQGHRKEMKKVIGQLQLHIVKHEDKGLDVDAENCAVCIENYKAKDAVRILPCKHIFHKTCIDPWLLDHRTCPMCKLDVIKALGCWREPQDLLELAVPESISGSISAESWSITVQEENRNDLSDTSAPSAHESTLNASRLKDDVGEATALLEIYGSDNQPGEFLPTENSQ